jgi:hypothetical protein
VFDGTDGRKIKDGGAIPSGGGGDVVGPASSTDNCIVAFDGVSGKAVKDSTINVSSISSKTTAAMSVYVDSAATGTGDGTSWTDAFTTIQAAINSLPVVLEHAVTIYIRKGASAYAENITIQQIVGKGSLTIRGEYYWYGECAAAATPSTTKFNLTATDGAQIAAGDPVLIRDGYADYIFSTVKATVDKGSDVWEIELNDALPTGNVGTGGYYTICKTNLAPTTGWTINNTPSIAIRGLMFTAGGTVIITFAQSSCILYDCFIDANVTYGIRSIQNSTVRIVNSLIRAQYSISSVNKSSIIAGDNGSGSYSSAIGCVLSSSSASTGRCLYALTFSEASALYSVIYHQNGTAVYVSTLSYSIVSHVTIKTGTTKGIFALGNSYVATTSLTNNATTPNDPATSTDNPVIV